MKKEMSVRSVVGLTRAEARALKAQLEQWLEKQAKGKKAA